MAGRFGSVITAMVTPFREDHSLDLDGAQDLARWLLDNGSDGLVVAGSTGEAPTLSDGEKGDLWRAVVLAASGRGKVIAGTGTYDTAHTIHLTHVAEEAGCDAVLVVTPYYNKPPQRGLLTHFGAVAESTRLPVVLYNIPGRTACVIEPDTLLRLARDVPNIVAVKDATADFVTASRVIQEAPPGFELYSGNDWDTFVLACLGGVGVISVASHVAGPQMKDMLELISAGNVEAARKLHRDLEPLYRALFITSNPIPVKAAMEIAGHPVGPPRLPLLPATDDERSTVERAMRGIGVL
jgi:4-hydroxy-tetrahydrodipicolinate synthase